MQNLRVKELDLFQMFLQSVEGLMVVILVFADFHALISELGHTLITVLMNTFLHLIVQQWKEGDFCDFETQCCHDPE